MISVILPSIRPANLKTTIEKFIESQWGAHYELVIVTDFQIDFKIFYHSYCGVKLIYEPVRRGPTEAICQAEKACSGEYVFRINDQIELTKEGLNKMLAFSRKHNDRVIVDQRTFPISPLKYYGKTFSPYPFVHRKVIEELGGYHLPDFKGFYADPDLSMRAHKAGIPILKCPGVSVKRVCDGSMDYQGHSENVSAYYKHDRNVFINKWGSKGFKEIAPGRRIWLWCRFLELFLK